MSGILADKKGRLADEDASLDDRASGMHEINALDPDLLRRRWRSVMGRPAPSHLSRQLLIRILFWREQVARVGDLSPGAVAALAAIEAASRNGGDGVVAAANGTAVPKPRPGTILVREHGGVLHRVMALDKGFVWNGKTHASLSSVARAITGTVWNGPRFFGIGNGKMSARSRPVQPTKAGASRPDAGASGGAR